MPIFQYNDGRQVQVADEHVGAFAAQNPDALSLQEINGQQTYVKAKDFDKFLKAKGEDHSRELPQPTRQPAAMPADKTATPAPVIPKNDKILPGQQPMTASMADQLPQQEQETDSDDWIYQRPTPNMSIPAQIRQIQKQRKVLEQRCGAREQALWKEKHAQQDPDNWLENGENATHDYMDVQNDEQVMAYVAAIRQMDEAIKELKAQKRRDEGRKNKFWAAAGNEIADLHNWDMGISDFRNAKALMNIDKLRDGTPEGEQAYNDLATAVLTNQDIQEAYSRNANFWERAGSTTGAMLPFMADFLGFGLVGGEGINVFGKVAGKAATKMATTGAGKAVGWTVKALGTTADDFIKGAIMANTIQAGHTGADIINRKIGDMKENPDGTYSLENPKTWSQAVWQAEGNQIIENASEMFGTHLPSSSKVIGKIGETFGAKRIGKVMAAADATTLGGAYATANKWLETLGISGTFGEISEEYVGQLEKTVLGIEDAYQQNHDGSRTNLFLTPQFHGDIWGGMFISMGLMNAPRMGMTGAAYASMKHDINKADTKCDVIFGDDWADMRKRIDNATNEQIGTLIDEIKTNDNLNDNQKMAVMDYVVRSCIFRGFNMAGVAASRTGKNAPTAPGLSPIEQQQTEGYLDGYNSASPQEMNDAKNQLAYQRQRVTGNLGEAALKALDEDANAAIANYRALMAQMNDAERDVAKDNLDSMIDYANAKAVYDGMMQGVRDDMDLKVTQSNELIDYQTNKADGQMHGATTRMDDHVYIIDGNVATLEDGSIDTQNSDDSIIIRHEDGKLEMVKPDMLVSVEDPVDAETAKATAAEAIRQSYAQEAAASIDGTVTSFNPGDTYTLTDDQGNQKQVTLADNGNGTADNGDGTVMATDQNGQAMRLTKDMIQQAADQANAARTAQFEQQRQQQGGPQTDTPTEETPEAPAAPEESVQEAQAPSALERIPTTPEGEPIFEKAESPDLAYDAIVEMADGDPETAQTVIQETIAEKEKDLKKAQSAKSAGGSNVAEKIASETARKSAIVQAQKDLDFWKQIAGTVQRRADEEAARQAEAQRQQQEAEAQRKAEEEAKAREAQEQMEREAAERAEAQRKAIEDARYKATLDKLKGNATEQQEQKESLFRTYGKGKKKFEDASKQVINDVKKVGTRLIKDLNLPSDIDIDESVKYYGNGKEYVMLFLPMQDGDRLGIEFDFKREDDYGNEFDGFRQTSGAIHIQNNKRSRAISEPVGLDGDITYDDLLAIVKEEREKYREIPFGPSRILTEDPDEQPTVGQQIEAAGAEVNTNPTEAQIEAGNYKKGHVQVGSFDITIENPAGSIRRGTDANGKEWQTEMKNTYGYIRGTEGVDGDHIDVFASNEIDDWNGRRIFVVDQYNPDGTFDEHKVMLGFNDSDDALSAYLDNYEKGWEKGRRIEISSIPASDFEKWINSSHRKTKPFAEYVNAGIEQTQTPEEVKKEPKSGGMHVVDLMGVLTDLKEKGTAKFSDHYVGEEKKEEKSEPYSAVLSRPYKVDPAEQNDFKKFGGIYKSVEKDIKALAGHLIDDLGVRDLQSDEGANSGINVQEHGIAAGIDDIVVRKKGKEYDEVGVSMHLGNDESGNVGIGYAAVSVVHHDSPTGPFDMTVWYTVDLKDGMTYGQFLNIIRKAIDTSKTGEPGKTLHATIDADGNLSDIWIKNKDGSSEKPAETKKEPAPKPTPKNQKPTPKTEEKNSLFPATAKELYSKTQPWLEKAMTKDARAIADRLIKDLNVADAQFKKDPDVKISDGCTDMTFTIPLHNYIDLEVRFGFDIDNGGFAKLGDGRIVLRKANGDSAAQYEISEPRFVKNLDYDKILEIVKGLVQKNVPQALMENDDKYRPENQGKGPDLTPDEKKKITDYPKIVVAGVPKPGESTTKKETSAGYSITPTKYTTKKGKDLDMHVVRFDKELSKEQAKEAGSLARRMKGWTDYKGGYWLRSDETAREFAKQMMEQMPKVAGNANTHEGVIETANRIAEEEENKKNAERGLPENAKKLGMPVDGSPMKLEEGDTVYIPVVAFGKDGKQNGTEYRPYTVAGMSDDRYVLRREGEKDTKMYPVELVAHDSWYVHNAKPEKESENEPVLKSRPRPLDEEDQDRVINSLRSSLRKAVKHLIKDLNLPTGVDADLCVNIDYEKLRTRLEIPAGDADLLVIDFSLDRNGGMMGGDIHVEDNKRKGHPMGLVDYISYRELRDTAKRAIELFRKEREHETKAKGVFDSYAATAKGDVYERFASIAGKVKADAQKIADRLIEDLGVRRQNGENVWVDKERFVRIAFPTGHDDVLTIEMDFKADKDGFVEKDGFHPEHGTIWASNYSGVRTQKQGDVKSFKGDISYEDLLALAKDQMEKFRKFPFVKNGGDLSFGPKEQPKQEPKAEPKPNYIVSDEKMAELKAKLKARLSGQLNVGLDPELFSIGSMLALGYIERGVRKFVDYAKKMIEDVGDAIRPYLKSFYNGARDMPGAEEFADEMTPYDEVKAFDTANFDKNTPKVMAAADNYAKEHEIEKQVDKIKSAESAESKENSVSSQDNQKETDNGIKGTVRNDESGTAGVRDGDQQRRGDGTERLGTLSGQESGGSDRGGKEGGKRELGENSPGGLRHAELLRNSRNFRLFRGEDNAPKSVDARINANIKAIELAQKIISERRVATPEEMAVLSRFSGWGGLGKILNDKDLTERVKSLVGDESFKSIQMAGNSSYFTPAHVVDAMWDIARQMGFKGGNILEGSAGIGNILAHMPEDISANSDIQAVEIDDTTGMILKLLYPDAQVDIQGFEKTKIANGSVDLAITNVPFVTNLHVFDETGDNKLAKKFRDIHDFCIAKNVRKLRPGGIGIFISSAATLDKSTALRNWITGEGDCDFIGAFRLNNETFGGTDATSDIIVIRKRINGQKSANAVDLSEAPIVRRADDKPLMYNRYYVEHPENMGGEMHFAFEKGDTSYRPNSTGLYPDPDKDQYRLLSDFVHSIKEEEQAKPVEEGGSAFVKDASAGERKQGELYVKDGRLVVADVGGYFPLEVNSNKIRGHTKVECFNAYAAVKTARDEVLKYQSENDDDKGLEPLLKKLNKAFDDFVDTYGHFVKNSQLAFLRNDVDYPSVAALETAKETINKKTFEKEIQYKKSDVMNGRVVGKAKTAKPESVKDGVLMSFANYGRIDLKYIAGQLGMDEETVRKEILGGKLGFENPVSLEIEPPFIYLSGNVREKLMEAKENNADGKYDKNVKALEKVIPIDIQPQDIEVHLGSTWIEPETYGAYIKERTGVDIKEIVNAGGRWRFDGIGFEKTELNKKGGVYSSSVDKWVYLTDIIMSAMSLTKIEVRKKTDEGTIRDEQAERLANQKVDEEKEEFRKWFMKRIQSDPDYSEKIQRVYNDKFNSYVRPVVPEEFAPRKLPGMSDKVTLKPHQARAVALALTKSLILAHEVGAGKTYTLIAIAMELRRLGRAKKPMIVVQPSTLEQFVTSAKTLYPNAKILAYDGTKFNGEAGRKNFYSLIKYNDWDMIIVPHSTFDFIPDSDERQVEFIRQKIREKEEALERIEDERQRARIQAQIDDLSDSIYDVGRVKKDDGSGKRVSSRMDASANKQRKGGISRQNAETKARNMLDRKVDAVENFDQMEIDALLIDEAHNYKKLGGETALAQSVKGVDLGYSQRAQGLYIKTRAVMEKNNGRNVVFATGTPISNTAAEVWNFMRYLMPDEMLDEYNMRYFDDFVNNFGNIEKDFEYTTSGNLKEVTRFRGYGNLPELARLWTSVADIVLNKDLVKDNVEDKRPAVENGKPTDVFLPQNDSLMAVMDYVRRCFDWYNNLTPMERYKNKTLPGKWYNMAQGAAVDARLVWDKARDEEDSKTNKTVKLTIADLKETEKYNGTVAIFCDRIQNPKTGFNLFDDIKAKLVKGGVPEDQIAIIKSGMSNKEKIFEKVNSGEIRVVMGSTFTLGTGVNIQERLHMLIHMDAPNRPMDYTQRNGRIHRQGNLHKDMEIPVKIVRLGIEDTLDKTAYQRLEFKAAFIDSLMNVEPLLTNNGNAVRVLNAEADELQNFGNTKANLSGNQYAILQSRAQKKVNALQMDSERWKLRQTYVKDTIPKKEKEIRRLGDLIAADEKTEKEIRRRFPDGTAKEITIMGSKAAIGSDLSDLYTEHNKKILQASRELLQQSWKSDRTESDNIDIDGLTFTIKTEIGKELKRTMYGYDTAAKRTMSYSCPALGIKDAPVKSGLIRVAVDDILQNVITGKNVEEDIRDAKESIENAKKEIALLKDEEGKPFPKEDELIQAESDLEEYTEKMIKEQQEIDAREAARRGGGHSRPTTIIDINMDFGDSQSGPMMREAPDELPGHDDTDISRMTAKVKNLAARLHLNNVRVVKSTRPLPDSRMNVRGYYDEKSGQIVVVVPNNIDVADAEKTLLHEAVAHYGLRQMFGNDFDSFLSDVYDNVSEDTRKAIDAKAQEKRWDTPTATEEYLASLAEDTDFEKAGGFWNRIRNFFNRMLRKMGFAGSYSDNELRYTLWKSYHALEKGVIATANDIAMQTKLGTRLVSPNGRSSVQYQKALAREKYEKRLQTSRYQSIEAWQDSMLGLKEAMEAIAGKKGQYIEDIDGHENAYLGENRLSSVNRAEGDAFSRMLFQPMIDEVAKLARNDAERDELVNYMMAKHGLERNRHMREQAIQKEFDETTKDWPKVPAEPELGDEELIDARNQLRRDLEEKYAEFDYAGLTALTGEPDVTTATEIAEDMVKAFETDNDTKALWEKVNAVNKAVLSKQYECGLISKELYEKIRDMYKWYIPLRGFDETVGEDAYSYLNHRDSVFNSPIRRAEGRRSKADDPFANMQQMAESAIQQGNRNKLVKQKFLNFVMNHPSDLVSVSDLWIRHDDATDEWVPVFPDLKTDDSADAITEKMQKFEERMEKLKAEDPDHYKHGREAAAMPYRIVANRDEKEHQVIVKRAGRDYVLTINGNPRAAQALNGQTNPDNKSDGIVGVIMDKVDTANRYLSAVNTTFNPNFMVSNFSRDMIYANSMVWVKESPTYAVRFHKNCAMANPFTMAKLLHKYQNNTLDPENKMEALFREFILNGGETGYTSARTLEQHRKDIDREIKEAQGRLKARRAGELVIDSVEDLNRAVELCGRFAAYVTSRDSGRSIDRAIYDAKEISVNFNKKGSGEKFQKKAGQTALGRTAAFTSGWGRHLYIFWNAAVQGLTNYGRQAKRHPAKFIASQAALFALGALTAALAGGGGDGDDDDNKSAYQNLPDYVRRSNILVHVGNYWMALPLSQEFRMVYGLGEIAGSLLSGRERMETGEIVEAVMEQISQAMPLDVLEGGGGWRTLFPSAIRPVAEAFADKSWTGMPIYNNADYLKDMPNWTKGYSNTNKYLTNLAAALNEATGGDKYHSGAIDLNPAVMEYILNSWCGGPFTIASQLTKTAETFAGQRDFDPQNIPLVNRVVKAGDERTEYRAVNEAYYKLKKERDITRQREKGYEKEMNRGANVREYAEKLNFLNYSPEYERAEIFDSYSKEIKALTAELKEAQEAGDDRAVKDIKAEINEVKKELIREAERTRKR